MAMPGNAPGTAKEPRPASHFRLVLQGVEGAGVYSGRIRKDSITNREIAPRQVMTYRAGRKLQLEFPALRARIADTFTKAQADQRFLLRTELGALTAPLLGKAEAEQTYAKKGQVVSGNGSLVSGLVQGAPAGATPVLTLPGIAQIDASGSPNGGTFTVKTLTADTLAVGSSERAGGTAAPNAPFELTVAVGRAVTLQLARPGAVATVTVSASSGGQLLAAQGMTGTP